MLASSGGLSITGAASTVIRDDLPLNKVVISDNNGKISSANVSIDDIISGSGINLNSYYTKTETDLRLMFKQDNIVTTSGTGTVLFNNGMLRRLIPGSGTTLTLDSNDNVVIGSTGSSSGIPSTIAEFTSTQITHKVPTTCSLGLTVANTLVTDYLNTGTIRSNYFMGNGRHEDNPTLFDGNHFSLRASTPLVCPVGSFKSNVSNHDNGRRICVGPKIIF